MIAQPEPTFRPDAAVAPPVRPTPALPSVRSRAASGILACLLCFLGVSSPAGLAGEATPDRSVSWEAPPARQTEGHFWRLHWYERESTPLNPRHTRRLRINSPNASLHPTYGHRAETQENGLVLINAPEDLFQATAAEFYAELWGGHPGTANKRVSINGRSTHLLPPVGSEEGHCTYSYPTVALELTDLVSGWNACQLAVEQGDAFWGHAMIDAACLRFALKAEHPDLADAGVAGFSAALEVEAGPDGEGFRISARVPEEFARRIARVHYQGWYDGFDENGNRAAHDWHGFTHNRRPVAWLGSVDQPPFTLVWDTSMLAAQSGVSVRALVEFKEAPNLMFLTAATEAFSIAHQDGIQVVRVSARDLPVPFWSRAGATKQCLLNVPVAPDRIERAELHVVTWTGGAGNVRDYFKLNGVHYPVAEGAGHEPGYVRLPVLPRDLRRGANEVRLLSDTEHHGIEVLLPGPALMIRYRDGE